MKTIIPLIAVLFLVNCTKAQTSSKEKNNYKVVKTTAEWKNQLSPNQYRILREAGTERPFSSPLNKNYKKGVYVCAACKTALYQSKYKYDSHTGWPSFDRAVQGNVVLDVDYKLGYERTELLCATCGGHLGHSFDDGPQETTGKRHCINGVALKFIPKK